MANLSTSIGSWSFQPLSTSFPPTVLPNIEYWNVTNGTWEYQIELSWPLNWTSTDAVSTVNTLCAYLAYLAHCPPSNKLTRFILDGNALAQTATEAFRKRRPVDSTEPDWIVVSIGYPDTLPDSPYSQGRYYDYQIPVCPTCPPPPPDQPGVPSNGENFLNFLDAVLRPWVRNHFPNVKFDQDGLYGHSFAGLFTVYTLLTRPQLFDVYLSASPFLIWNNEYIFSDHGPLKSPPVSNSTHDNSSRNATRPALQLSYGGYEEFPRKRRTETQEEFEARKAFLSSFKYETLAKRLYKELRKSDRVRNVELREYPFSYHAAVGSAALCDGIDYLVDW